MNRKTLIDNRGHSVDQRAIDNVGVTGHPANVGRAPVDIVGLVVEHPFERAARVQVVTCRRMPYPLGFASRSTGIEDKQRVLRVHFLRRAVRRTGAAEGG